MNFYRIVFFFVVSLLSPAILPATGFAQSGNVWGVTPVFDGGRVMPLHTFSRQIVREICGSERPFIVRDDSILTQLSQMFAARPTEIQAEQGSQYPFLVPGTDVFGETNAGFAVPTHPVETESDGPALASLNFNLNRAEMERILQRVRALVPQRGRYFDADELVLSWLGEPEIWEFIPIFSVSENDFRTEVLGIPLENDSRTALNRVSVFQLENSVRYQHRLVDMARRQSHRVEPSVDIPFDRVAARLDEALKTYQELTYHPARQRPRRMLDLLSGTVDARAGREAPFISALESWAYLLSVGDVPERQTVDFHLANEKLAPSLHPTTQRWHAILQQIQLLHGAFLRENAQGKMEVPNLWAVERLFETIIQSIDLNLEESAALMERIYPGTAFRKDNSVTDVGTLLPLLFSATSAKQNEESVSRIILNYHYSIKKLRREIMAAYLALYDNGKSLRVVPLGSELALGGPENSQSGVQPWGTMQMLLYGGDAFVRRFFDPQFQLDVAAARPAWLLQTPVADDPASETVSEESTDEGEPMSEENALERDLFARDDSSAVNAVSRSPADLLALGPVGNVRGHFRNLATAYTMLTQEYARTRLDGAASDLQRALRETAGRSNAIRLEFLDDDHVATNEFIAKTGYPGENPMLAEYRYYRLAPFFWMWIFAACALVMACFSYVLGRVRHEQTARSEEETALLGTRSDFFRPEEWLLWGGILFIVLSIAVTFLGGVQRAWISGWAPVTNMYETIVLMAFSASLFGLWYVLAPLIHPPLVMAWRYTSFPTWERIRYFWLSAKAVVPLPATQGEQAIREAAELFGATGGSQITSQQNSHEAQSRSTFSWQVGFFVPRILLMFLTFFAVVHLAYGEYAHEHGAFAAAAQMLKLSDFIDWIVVVASVALIVWGVPHLLLTFILFPILLAWPSRIAAVFRVEPVSAHEELRIGQGRNTMRSVLSGEGSELHAASSPGRHWLSLARNEIMDRSLFILISAAIALLAGLAAHFNSTQFNPDIRPIAAVLRSNFWLTVHVIAIIVSYAAAMIAWGMAVVALGAVIFGRYRYSESPDGRQRIALPPLMEMMSPIIDKLLHLAMLLLILGTVLGARWADYSWGRFWSWDPKEVWALITILFYAIVIHGRVARFYGIIGVTVGALFGSIAVIFTWYGINFMFKGSVHSYGGGAGGQATLFMMTFIGLNILWGSLALFRYNAVMFGRDGDDNGL